LVFNQKELYLQTRRGVDRDYSTSIIQLNMSALGNIYFKLDTLETLVNVLKKKGEKGISIDFSINDKTDNYGQNVSSYISQSKEERESGKDRYYTGNGRVFWTSGSVNVAEKQEVSKPKAKATVEVEDDLPF
jgi:hypothetical protein